MSLSVQLGIPTIHSFCALMESRAIAKTRPASRFISEVYPHYSAPRDVLDTTENDTINLDLCQGSWHTKNSALVGPPKMGCLDSCRSGVANSVPQAQRIMRLGSSPLEMATKISI